MQTVIVLESLAGWIQLIAVLAARGPIIIVGGRRPLHRHAVRGVTVVPQPETLDRWRTVLCGADVVIHLSSSGHLGSVARALSSLPERAAVLVTASSVAYYGAGDGVAEITERAPSGSEGTAHAVRMEEEATAPAREAGIRVCIARMGSWIDANAGLLRYLVPLYKCRAGLRPSDEGQVLSWCHSYDVARAIEFAIDSSTIHGPFNAVSPESSTIELLDEAVTEALDLRPAIRMSVSTAALLLGERFTRGLALGPRIVPGVLADAGFAFVYSDLRSAVLDALCKEGGGGRR